jgi:hypothetical protein
VLLRALHNAALPAAAKTDSRPGRNPARSAKQWRRCWRQRGVVLLEPNDVASPEIAGLLYSASATGSTERKIRHVPSSKKLNKFINRLKNKEKK